MLTIALGLYMHNIPTRRRTNMLPRYQLRHHLDKKGLSRLARGFHSVRTRSGVFWAPSLLPEPHGGEVNGARVGSQRDCFMMSLLGDKVFSHGVIRWMVYPTPCISLLLTAAQRGDRAYLYDIIQSRRGDGR
jgi:hypothetical protein